MDKIKSKLPLRPAALLPKLPPSRIVKFRGEPKKPEGPQPGLVHCILEFYKAIFKTVSSLTEELLSGKARQPAPKPTAKEESKTPSRKATIIPIGTDYHE